ncbi:MAG: glycoside hydrolase family 27 protein, partial [Mucilaginibacter sp.]
YIVVDFLWSYDNPPGSTIGNPFQKRLQDGSYIPWLYMDRYGRLTPDVNKFPSAFKHNGFKPLADYIHKLGLKFGIHVMRGIPRQAVWAKSPVLGTRNITADMIADTNSVCPWMNHMYGINMDKPGAQEYLNSILNLYASWGVDFIKVDDIARPYSKKEIEGYQKAISQCGRPMVLSLSPGETPLSEAGHVKTFANMWRIADDFWDNWKEVLQIFKYAKSWEGIGGPGHWPDCDMLQIGKLSKRGPVGPERYSRFTTNELYTHMTFWCIARSPLMMGGNMPENRSIDKALLTNPEVLAVDQKGMEPHQLYVDGEKLAWCSKSQDSNARYVALFNLSDKEQYIGIDFDSAGLQSRKILVRDLWNHSDKGVFQGRYEQKIEPHGCALLKLTANNITK